LAQIAVQIGLGHIAGQQLIMTAPFDAAPLARRVTEHGYRAGASLVTTLFADDDATLLRFRWAPDDRFDAALGGFLMAWRQHTEMVLLAWPSSAKTPRLLAGDFPRWSRRAVFYFIYNILFDENAASHIALGQAYKCIVGGAKMSEGELVARGANRSAIHIDWMIGSKQMDVDGLAADGWPEPLMRHGEWVS
jgi:leucyl aminopeptidase (aminopeptidase T)